MFHYDTHGRANRKGGIIMKKSRRSISAAVLACVALLTTTGVQAAFDEHLDNYQLDAKVVKGDRTKDQFGNTVTEQSYYRTGGDVKVITREEIEKRHYSDVTEAIKRVPGVAIQSPGYRGGEYGYLSHNNSISINGDTHVIILVDGHRVDNITSDNIGNASEYGSKSTGVNIDQVINMNAVDKIEVIKGPGASTYGSDATGGVINIITRKGTEGGGQGTLDISTGSWGKHKYDFTYLGSAGNDNSLHYFVGLNRVMSGDTKYVDGSTGITGTLGGSKFDEKGANIRIDKDFNDTNRLSISYRHQQGRDGYPVSTPNLKYWNQKDWNRIVFEVGVGRLDETGHLVIDPDTGKAKYLRGDDAIPGFRNLFGLHGIGFDSYNQYQNNDIDVKYTFDRQSGMESFVRLYNQNHKYWGSMLGTWSHPTLKNMEAQFNADFPNGATDKDALEKWMKKYLAPFPGGSREELRAWVEKVGGKAPAPTSYVSERNRGVQLQLARSIGKHDVIGNITYDRAANYYVTNDKKGHRESFVKRNSIYGYVQDKVHVNDRFDVTPAIRFTKYSDAKQEDGSSKGGDSRVVTPALNLQYRFGDNSTVYAGWAKIVRPLHSADYGATYTENNIPLQDEKGNVFTLGYHKELGKNTILGINYSLMDMSNAIALVPIVEADNEETAVNATEKRSSFNVTLDHKINEHWNVGLAYSHLRDSWKAKHGYTTKEGWKFEDPAGITSGINNLRPANHYTLNVNYDNNKVSSGLLMNYYTGSNTSAFTAKRFLVLDWNLNYNITKDLTTYLAVTNLTNEAYETIADSYFGPGGSAMPSRQIMVGANYKF